MFESALPTELYPNNVFLRLHERGVGFIGVGRFT